MTLERRSSGAGGLMVSAESLGCMGMSELYGVGDESESIATIHNEELVGRAIAGRRDEVVPATKFGIVRGSEPTDRSIRGDAAYVKQACEASLARLGVDHIDLYNQHRSLQPARAGVPHRSGHLSGRLPPWRLSESPTSISG